MVMRSDEIINAVLRYVDEHIEENITTEGLADAAGYSEYHFTRIFKEHTKCTVSEYVCRRKLIKASEDIINGMKVIDAALKYGWQSHSGFTKAFNREFGFSPSLLRAMLIELEGLGGSAMSHVFMRTTEVGASKEELLGTLKNRLRENGISIETDRLEAVYKCACRMYRGVKRHSGEEYVTHTINVAIILAELEAEEKLVLSGMLCDAGKKGVIALKELQNELTDEVYDIVWELQNMEGLTDASDDIIIIKLAERLHNMRTIEFIDAKAKRAKAEETIEIYMPLARKLNNRKLIDELNDLSMRYYAGQE